MEKRRGALLGLMVVALLGLSGVARADHASEMKAREDFAAGRYDEALELFAKLYAETLNPVYLRNIGRCHQKLRHPDKAIDAFKDYLAKGKKISADERAEINGYIKEMQDLRDEQAKQGTPQPRRRRPRRFKRRRQRRRSRRRRCDRCSRCRPPAVSRRRARIRQARRIRPATRPRTRNRPAPWWRSPVRPAAAQSSPVYTRWWFWTLIGAAVVGGVVAAVVLSGGTDRPGCPTGVEKCL